MNSFSYENQGTNTYLVYSISQEDIIDSMSLGMLTNNKIQGLATTLFMQMDTQKFIKYNVSSRISVKQFFAGAVNKKRLLGVFKGIVNALLSAEDYMIDESTILLDLDYIFADVATCDTVLICLPIQGAANKHDYGAFFKEIMFSTQFDQTENCDYVARIINYLNGTPTFALSDFVALLEKVEGKTISAVSPDTQIGAQPAQKPVVRPNTAQSSEPIPAVQRQAVSVATRAGNGGAPENSVPAQPSKTSVPIPSGGLAKSTLAVPGVVEKPTPQGPMNGETTPEKKISIFGLMMHYSKENAELYKAQKQAKKNSGKNAAASGKAQEKSKPSQPPLNPGFAVPGQTPSIKTGQPIGQVQNQPANTNQMPVNSVPVQQPAFVPIQVPQGQSANFGETTILGGGAIGETTVLSVANSPSQMIAPHLIRRKNNEKISLNKPVFHVGNERGYSDYLVSDNRAISHSHASFIIRDGAYFVVDTNSRNHTFVNGKMIQSNVETEISHGDIVRLANEDFEFKIY